MRTGLIRLPAPYPEEKGSSKKIISNAIGNLNAHRPHAPTGTFSGREGFEQENYLQCDRQHATGKEKTRNLPNYSTSPD